MACHTPPLKKVRKQGEMPLPSLGPIPLKNVEFRDGMGPRLGNGITPCFLTLRGEGGGVFTKELHDSHACNDCSGSTISIIMNRKRQPDSKVLRIHILHV